MSRLSLVTIPRGSAAEGVSLSFSQPPLLTKSFLLYIEANQNPRGMLKRISTFARTVIKRPSSAQLLHIQYQQQQQRRTSESDTVVSTPSASTAPTTTTNTAVNTPTAAFSVQSPNTNDDFTNNNSGKAGPENLCMETVSDQTTLTSTELPTSSLDKLNLHSSPSSNPVKEPGMSTDKVPRRHPHRKSVAGSDVSSVGSLTLAPSSESLHVKSLIQQHNQNGSTSALASLKTTGSSISTTDTTTRPQTLGRQSPAFSTSVASEKQKFLEAKETRKATLRLGTQSLIAAKAQSLQQQTQPPAEQYSPNFVPRPEIDRLRTITKRETATKPPVKSLISFWEQSTDPLVEV